MPFQTKEARQGMLQYGSRAWAGPSGFRNTKTDIGLPEGKAMIGQNAWQLVRNGDANGARKAMP
eukprot:1161112-Pelagomonas_calceolata.AAC.7